jgi:hypothetical protein
MDANFNLCRLSFPEDDASEVDDQIPELITDDGSDSPSSPTMLRAHM